MEDDPLAEAVLGRDQRRALVALYDDALPDVYGYLVSRCGSANLAEELTAETFLAAAAAVRRGSVPELRVAWLIAVARHKLVDHWRAEARRVRQRDEPTEAELTVEDGWDVRLDQLRARETLARLGPHHRSALSLRYLDDLPVPIVAEHLGRTVHATEALLVRARAAFRRHYEQEEAR